MNATLPQGEGVSGDRGSSKVAQEAFVLTAIGLRNAQRAAVALAARSAGFSAADALLECAVPEGGEDQPPQGTIEPLVQGHRARRGIYLEPSGLAVSCALSRLAWASTAREATGSSSSSVLGEDPKQVRGIGATDGAGKIRQVTSGSGVVSAMGGLEVPSEPAPSDAARMQFLCRLAWEGQGLCMMLLRAFSCQRAGRIAGCLDSKQVSTATAMSYDREVGEHWFTQSGMPAQGPSSDTPGRRLSSDDAEKGGTANHLLRSWLYQGKDTGAGEHNESPLLRPLLCLRAISVLGFTAGVSLQLAR